MSPPFILFYKSTLYAGPVGRYDPGRYDPPDAGSGSRHVQADSLDA